MTAQWVADALGSSKAADLWVIRPVVLDRVRERVPSAARRRIMGTVRANWVLGAAGALAAALLVSSCTNGSVGPQGNSSLAKSTSSAPSGPAAPTATIGVEPATLDDPRGCTVAGEGPSAIVTTSLASPPRQFSALLGQQFETAELTAVSPGRSSASDGRVLKVIGFQAEPNGMTYTEFQAVGIGPSLLTVTRTNVSGATSRLQVLVTVACHL